MSAAVARITSGPVDPDLEQALPELAGKARRIRQLESIIRLPEGSYATRSAQLLERGELYADFENRAERLNIPGEKPGRALLLMTEEAERLFQLGRRRKPTLAQVLVGLRAVADAAARDLGEAECDVIQARYREIESRRRVSAGQGAVAYLEACRG